MNSMPVLSKKKETVKTLGGITLAALVLVLAMQLPESGSMTAAGIRTVGIVVAFLVLLVTEALPLTISCWIMLGLMPLLGVTQNFSSALTGFSNQVVFFILASFGIADGFTTIPLSRRILIKLLHAFGRSVSSMLFAIMLCGALVSSIVSNVPTCAIFMAIGLSFLELYENEEDKRRSGRAFMIGIPISSMIGGMMTPAGSSINLLAIGLLEQLTGHTVTFIQWMGVGIPLTAILLPIAWFLIVKIYKPAEISSDMVVHFIKNLHVTPKMSDKEIKMLLLTFTMLALWIASSWIRSINVMVVALLGVCAMFLPGIRILEFNKFIKGVSFDSFFLVGTVLSMGSAMVANGVSAWLLSLLPTATMSLPMLIAFSVALVFILLLVIPVAPSLVTLMASPLIALAMGSGHNPAILMLTLGLCAANCYLLPLDTVTLLTYGTGYYSMTDMPKSTLPLQLVVVLVMAVWIPIGAKMMGMH